MTPRPPRFTLFPYTTLFRSGLDGPVNRRQMLSVMGASLAMAGLTACTKPPEDKIVPYVTPPEILVPGKPLRSEEHTSELQSLRHLVCRLLLEKKKNKKRTTN